MTKINILYSERIFVGYRYFDEIKIEPLFLFGYELSYTTLEYRNLSVSANDFTNEEGLTVQVKIRAM